MNKRPDKTRDEQGMLLSSGVQAHKLASKPAAKAPSSLAKGFWWPVSVICIALVILLRHGGA